MRSDWNIQNKIFILFENARVLFNDYYIWGKKYSDEDIEKIKELIDKMKENIEDIESEMM